jgi:cation:H+ antiporter
LLLLLKMSHLAIILEFVIFGLVTWVAGIWLAHTTDVIDAKYKLGSAFGGILILGIVTSLPEIAVVITAALQKHYGIIIGTLLGGIAIQTAVIAIFDFKSGAERALSYSAASLTLVLEACFVVLVTVASLMAIKTPVVIPHTAISLASVLIVVLWLVGLWVVFQARKGLPWKVEAIAGMPGREHEERMDVIDHPALKTASMPKVFGLLAVASGATLVAGYGLATTGNDIAGAFHISVGLFAATFIALAGALPNISTGIASIKMGDYSLAMSDIFGGNAFMPALFVICDLISGNAVLKNATSSDIWFAALGVLLTTIYAIGLIVRPKRVYFRLGIDSLFVVLLYITGITLLALSH